jgi:hypothetical protein
MCIKHHARMARHGDLDLHYQRREFCIRGHPLTEETTYRQARGRRCRICQREANRQARARTTELLGRIVELEQRVAALERVRAERRSISEHLALHETIDNPRISARIEVLR